MKLYDVMYYWIGNGRLLPSGDSCIPWTAISPPQRGQVAVAICRTDPDPPVWLDSRKTEIPTPPFAR